ncbi:ester cyclase [Asanoa ferruginea]|uniref:ester cyclase n=1 Tax=Asanoa ferruginea TaxID=53367 RepID=UPI001940EB37|nr:ester cyclase [Asanoa ferruginea]GIF49887.1 ester cyclase [Asanoa ferruginea]
MGAEQQNLELMQTLDDAWNSQDLDTFNSRHADDVVVRWPGRPETHGRHNHEAEAVAFFTAFPDQHLDNRPYKVLFGSGEWTCSVAHWTGTMTGALGDVPPTGRSFSVDFCTVAHWVDGRIVEENLFYDLTTFMKQVGLA